jgi:hypothetical protein
VPDGQATLIQETGVGSLDRCFGAQLPTVSVERVVVGGGGAPFAEILRVHG